VPIYSSKKVRRLYMKRVSTKWVSVVSDKRVSIGIDVHKDSSMAVPMKATRFQKLLV
jgi:hypothetical protein